MIERVLEAYEEEVIKNKIPYIKKMDFFAKCVFGVYLLGIIVCIFLIIFIHTFPVYLFVLFYFTVVQYVVTAFLERVHHKKWKRNIDEYHDELDKIIEILKREDFNLYDKIKIKQLIRKYHQEIDRHDKKRNCKNGEVKDFIFTYIVPIVAFFAGKINNTIFSSNSEWIAVGIVMVSMVVFFRYVYSSLVEIARMISWNILDKEKAFVPKLQDILDRDFVIENEDLISIN